MAQLPIDSNTKEWINARSSWIIDQFGRERIRNCEIVTSRSEVIPNHFRPIEEDARILLDNICNHLQLDPEKVDLQFYYEGERIDGGETTLGVYEPDGDRFVIWIEVTQLHDPPQLAATIAHELCHVHLLGHGRVTADADDHEPLTDLLTVFLGLGIFTANAALYDVNTRSGNLEMWQIQRRGYLTMPMFGYALALFSQVRDEFDPNWPKHLRPDVRQAFRQSLRHLKESGLPDLTRVRTTTSRPSFIFPDEGTESDSGKHSAIAGGTMVANSLECNFCGVAIDDVNNNSICAECHESIAENDRELQQDEEHSQWTFRIQRLAARLFFGAFIIVVVFLLIAAWLDA